jgi:cyclopropane-fatty-acyl-phospholipid synthase
MVVANPVASKSYFQDTVQHLLDCVDIRINGDRPWDIRVHDDRFYSRLLAEWSLAAGESYVEGWWDCDRLDQLFYCLLRGNLDQAFNSWTFTQILQAKLINFQSRQRAYQVGRHHYDRGNRLYQAMLDPRMIYSCGYWREANTLEAAQTAKLDLIAHKLDLQPGMRVLDIGCGWGGTAQYLAEQYQVNVVGVTVSTKQAEFAKAVCQGLPIEIRLQDYRDLDESFDRILSVGMFEHVGYKNYRTYFECVRRCLADDGRFLLQTIGSNQTLVRTEPWIEKYIFPNSMLPSVKQIATAIEGLFVLEDWHNFGADYDKTLMAWFQNFDAHWPQLRDEFDPSFYRLWKYYLLSCAGAFRARKNHLWQLLLTPNGIVGGYQAIR